MCIRDRVDGQVLDFETSGMLTNSNKIMIDVQTDTLWSHLEGTGTAGPLEGVELEQFPVETTTWAEWVDAHPDTETLTIPDPIFSDNPEQGAIAYDYDADSLDAFLEASAERMKDHECQCDRKEHVVNALVRDSGLLGSRVA